MKFFLLFIATYIFANPLQEAIDAASAYSTIKLHRGVYQGNIVINKPLTIVGVAGQTFIRGDGLGSVIRVESSHVELRGLNISNSGFNMQKIDAGISMYRVKDCHIKNCHIENVLYGIDMAMVQNSSIEHNVITTQKNDISLRGDGLKIYYSHNNTIRANIIKNVRDVTLDYSNNNLLQGNKFFGNRFATHISNSDNNKIVSNIYKYNSVAMMFMGAKNTSVVKNQILSSRGAAGIGVMIGGIANFVFKQNRVSYNAKALYIQGQEKFLGMKRYIIDNEISYNAEALHFHATIRDNTIMNNKIYANIEDVVKDVDGDFENSNKVAYNYWDRYEGFDTNGDKVGDTPYEVYQYGDMLWHHNNKIKFFYASPIMTILNFISHLAPFVEPNLIMRDAKPIYLSP
ncbi:nitrous oxide reductase family maturation protein NosD [Sulfurimonas sp.]